jgi:phage tail sheath protein FI
MEYLTQCFLNIGTKYMKQYHYVGDNKMALNSPGVEVSVIDESFYLPAAPSTVPLIFVASAANKQNASGTGLAVGTDPANAGKVYLITSQRDLTDTFGTPLFYTDSGGNPVHGGELNEYGLQAAYSVLGVSSRAYIARADLDLGQLSPSATAPAGSPVNGTYWTDTSNSKFGIFEWNRTTGSFISKTPLIIDNDNASTTTISGAGTTPKPSFGSAGQYAIVVTSDNNNTIWYKNSSGNWVAVGTDVEQGFTATATFSSTSWKTSFPTVTATKSNPNLTGYNGNTMVINGETITLSGTTISALAESINSAMRTKGVGAKVNSGGYLELYADARARSNGTTLDGRITIAEGTGLVDMLTDIGLTEATSVSPVLFQGPHTKFPDFTLSPTGSVYVKTTNPNAGADWSVKLYEESSGAFSLLDSPIFTDHQTAINTINATGDIAVGSVFIQQNHQQGVGTVSTSSYTPQLASFKIWRRNATGSTKITSVATTGTVSTSSSFFIAEGLPTSTNGVGDYDSLRQVDLTAGDSVDDVISAINALNMTYVTASATSNDSNGNATSLTIQHSLGGQMILTNGTGSPLTAFLGFSAWSRSEAGVESGTRNLYAKPVYSASPYSFFASNWKPLVYEAKASMPVTDPVDGQLWYSSVVDEVDIMAHDGNTWVGYLNAYPLTDPAGPQVAALAPTTQSNGDPLVDNDVWISTADIDEYGLDVYVRSGGKWVAQDVADQTTPDGWLFADARWSTVGTTLEAGDIVEMLSSDYLDPDAPDPALYPKGMKLWNLRRSGFNVKKFVSNHININATDGKNPRYNDEQMDGGSSTTPYVADRWITVSPNRVDGAGSFGRHAQRGFVIAGFKSMIDTNQSIRDTDTVVFNLIATPGYPEAIQNMIAFNVDRGQTAFIVGDTPFRLQPNGTALSNWGNNTALAFDNNEDGAVSYDEYMAMFYPSGFANDNFGNFIVVPPSHMMLRTIAISDQKSFQWFAPAGTRRGGVDNATSVGYLENGEFKTTALPQSLRDVLAGVKINPIATIPGAGLVNFGQYTRARNASALDRINVVRLVAFLRRQLNLLAKPFLFEPNDRITRNEIKQATESFLLELVGQRALYDFLVVCDESNNTPTRVDRSELWLDIAIEPVKAVEFIYIPLRIKNTGDIAAGL